MRKTKVKRKENLKGQKAITLIALVITIIVLLILAAVSIATLTGENGILTQAQTAKENTEKASLIEQVQVDILGEQTKGNGSGISAGTLKTILGKYFAEDSIPEDANEITTETILTAKEEYGGYEIPVSDMYKGEIVAEKEALPTTESYVGYYADLNNDGKITLANDGIIYADLAVRGSGTWNNDDWSSYSYDAVTSGLNEYVIISETSEVDPLKTGKGIIQLSQENATDRFYIMALEDINPGTSYCWYDAAYDNGGKLDKIVATDYNDFGQGRENSEYVMAKWDDASLPWGAHNDNSTYLDLWGVIKDKYEEGWFVPSKAEWSAFGDYLYTNCGLTTDNYADYGLSGWYWSSSQFDANRAYRAGFGYGYIYYDYVNLDCFVRLSATF